MTSNKLLEAIRGNQAQSSQAASTNIGRSIDSQQAAFSQALKEQPSTYKTWNPDPVDTPKKSNNLLTFTPEWQEQQAKKKQEQEKPKKKGLFGITIPDGSENPWDYDATNNIIDTSVPAKPSETPKVKEPKEPEKKQLEYSDAFLKQEDQKDAWQPTWSNDQTIMDKEKVNDIERVIATTTGAAKQYGSGMVNLLGTVATGFNEAGDALGGNTNPYAGFATDPLSESQIGYEHDPEFYEREKKYTDSVLATADRLSESAAADLEKAKDGLGFLGQAGVDIATNVIQMGFDTATAALTGGASALIPMFLRSAGGKAQEARQEGATTAQQLLSGALSGGVEVFTEKIADGLAGIYGKGFADDVTEEFIRKLAKTDLGRTTLRLFSNAVSEGGEEVLSDLLNPLVEMVYNNKDMYASYKDLNLSDILYDFFIGAAVGGLGGTVNIANGGNAEANANLRGTDAVEHALAEQGVDAYTAEQIAPAIEKAINGEQLTNKEKNILAEIRNSDAAASSPQVANILNEILAGEETTEAESNPLDTAQEKNVQTEEAPGIPVENTVPEAAPANPLAAAEAPAQIDEFKSSLKDMTNEQLDELSDNLKKEMAEAEEGSPEWRNLLAESDAVFNERWLSDERFDPSMILNPAAAAKGVETETERTETPTPAETAAKATAPTTESEEAGADSSSENASESHEDEGGESVPDESKNNLKINEEQNTEESAEAEAEEPETAEEEREITPEMEEAERAANSNPDITEKEQKRIDNVLNKTIQAREEASAKAAQTTIPEKAKPVDQTKRTTVQTADKADVRKAARSLVTQEESTANTVEVSDKLQQLADYIVQNDGESIDYSTVEQMAGEIADTVLDGATIEIDSGARETGQAVKDYLKTTPLRLDPSYMNDVSGDFSDFRKKYRGKIKFADNGLGVDVAYMELADMFPGYFPEDITHPADQLIQIADVLSEAEPQLVNRYDVDNMYDQAHAELTSQIIDTVLSDVIGQTAPTFADKMYAKLDALRSKDAIKLKELREQKNERMKEIRQQAAEAKREAVAKEKAEKWKKVKEVQDYYQGVIERGNNRRKSSGIRKKIKGLAKDISNRLTKPKEGHYVPQDLVKAAVDLLGSLDFNTGNENTAVRLDKLNAAYRQLMADPVYGSVMTDDVIQARLDQLAEYVGGTRIADMSVGQLEAVYDVVNNIAKNIDEAVKIKIKGEEYNAFTLSEALRQEVANAKSWGKNRLSAGANAWYSSAVLRPTTFLERLGGFVKDSKLGKVGEMLNDGQRRTTEEIVRGSQKFADLTSDPDSATLRDTVSIGKDAAGNDIEISKGMRAALYMHLMNEDNTRHIKYGGLTIPGIDDYYKGNNDGGFGTSHTRALGISPELAKLQREYREIAKEYQTIDAEETKDAAWQDRIDDVVERMDAKEAEIDALYEAGEDYIARLRADIEKDLTPIERRWVDTAREYLDEMQNTLNDTTLDVYGFKKALVDNYFPIITDPNFRAANFESIAKDMSLENSGFMKNRVTAANPMLLLDISEVVNRYMDNSAKYVGLMPAIRQFNKLYGKSQSGFAESLKDTIASKYGNTASTYIENLIADLTGARKSGDDFLSPFFAKARGHMAQAALSLNPRVALSQAASYINAASEIGWKPLMDAFNGESNPAKDADVMKLVTKWSPLEYYRSMGYSTTELGDVKSDSRIENRAMKKLGFAMRWIEMVDTRTVGRLWYAAEAYTQQMNPDLEVGSDEYYQETAKTFNRVVERTQPNYTVMQRPGILRSTSDITKSLTMFMTQRLQNFNILYEAGQRFAQYESDFRDGKNGVTEEDLNQAKTDLSNAVTSQIASTAMLVALKAGVDALLHSVKGYRDDDDELTGKSIISKIADMYADAMLGNLLGGSELYSFAKSLTTGQRYYGISMSGVDTFSDLLTDIVNAYNASEEKKAAKWAEVAKTTAQFFGIPVNNAQKIIDGIRFHAEDIANGNFGKFVAGTDYQTSPDTVTDNDGNNYALSSEEQKAYSDRYSEYRDSLYENFRNSRSYGELSEDQIKKIESELNSIAKDNAKSGYFSDSGIDYSSDVQILLSGKDAPGTANDKTALSANNIVDYVVFKNGFNDSVKNKDYASIDKYIREYSHLNKNTKTVLSERNSELRNLLKYNDIGVGSKSYYAVDESINKAKATLDKSSEGSDVKMLGLANANIPESERAKIINGVDGFVSQAMKNSYNILSGYGFNSKQVYDFFSESDYKVNKQTGEVVTSGKGTLDAAEAAYGISQLPGLTDSQRSAIFNEMKKSMSNYYNDWKNYTYTSEINYINNKSKYSYGKGGKISSGSRTSSSSTGNNLLDAFNSSRGKSGGSKPSSSSGNTLLETFMKSRG